MSQERFEDLLPWFVNGTIGADDRAWFESYVEAHPAARAEVDWLRSTQKRMLDSAPAVPATIGLARTMHLIRGDQPTWSERISAFFGGFGMRPGVALAAFALVAIQGGVIVGLMDSAKDDAAELRALRATTVTEGYLLKLNFAPEAKEADIRLLLVSVNGTVTGGPGQLGDWFVRVPAGQEAKALESLKSNPIVQAAALAPGLPPRE